MEEKYLGMCGVGDSSICWNFVSQIDWRYNRSDHGTGIFSCSDNRYFRNHYKETGRQENTCKTTCTPD